MYKIISINLTRKIDLLTSQLLVNKRKNILVVKRRDALRKILINILLIARVDARNITRAHIHTHIRTRKFLYTTQKAYLYNMYNIYIYNV